MSTQLRTMTVTSQENLGPVVRETLDLPAAALTAEQIITLRVQHYTATRPVAEQTQAVRQAIHAFTQGLFLLVVDERRVTDLQEVLTLTDQTQIAFWRLIPLAGG
jgi:hypothetical protein